MGIDFSPSSSLVEQKQFTILQKNTAFHIHQIHSMQKAMKKWKLNGNLTPTYNNAMARWNFLVCLSAQRMTLQQNMERHEQQQQNWQRFNRNIFNVIYSTKSSACPVYSMEWMAIVSVFSYNYLEIYWMCGVNWEYFRIFSLSLKSHLNCNLLMIKL